MTISECVRSSPWWGVLKSLVLEGAGPVGLLHSQKTGIKYKKPSYSGLVRRGKLSLDLLPGFEGN